MSTFTAPQLTGALDIYAAGEVRNLLRTELQARSELILDLSQVEACDTAGLQVLCSARRTAQEAGMPFRIAHSSAAIDSMADAMGLKVGEFQP